MQHFGHAVDRAGTRVEGDFDEVSGGELLGHVQQTTVDGNRLQLGAGSLAAFGHHRGGDRSIELYTRRTVIFLGMGEVGHSQLNYGTLRRAAADYESAYLRAYAGTGTDVVLLVAQVCDNNGSNFPACRQKSTFCPIGIDKTTFT